MGAHKLSEEEEETPLMPVLEASETEQFQLRLQEIIASDSDLKTRLLFVRQLLETIYKTLSAESKTSFNGLFARMQYVNASISLPVELVTQVNQLRLLCNKVTHEKDFVPPQDAFPSSVYVLNQFLNWLAPDHPSLATDQYLADINASPFPAFKPRRKWTFHCVVLDWKLLRQDNEDCGIELQTCSEEGLSCTIQLNNLDKSGRHWSSLNKVLWKYCSLHCIDLTGVLGQESCYQSGPTSMIVVEPDFLMDASALASCFTNQGYRPEYFVVNQLLKDSTSDKQMLGNMVNNILDELICAPEADYAALFRQSMARQPISMVALGKDSALNIYKTVFSSHLPQIRQFIKSVQGEDLQLEPSFISPEYGLQGRLDILYFRAGIPHIVELKAGNPPHYDIWKQHQMQVIAYNMIIRNCFDMASRGTSSILYSATGENTLRHVVNTLQLEQDLLMCRNRVLGILRQLSEQPKVFFDWLITAQVTADTPYMQTNIQTIVSTLRSLPDYQYEWFLEQLRLLVREVWFVKTGGLRSDSIYGHNSLWQQSVAVKQERYRLLSSLQVDSLSFNLIRFKLSSDGLITDFRSGDVVLLYRQNLPVSRQQILRGHITQLSETSLEVQIRGGLRQDIKLLSDSLWALEHDVLEASLYAPLSSLFGFLQCEPSLRELILGLQEPESNPAEAETGAYLEDIVRKIQASRHYHIVQGPPGTGKTSGLLTAYAGKLYRETPKNLLVLSFTNRAVDEICLCLKREGIPFIRTGSSDEIKDELLPNLIRDQKFDAIAGILKSNRVWVATVSSCNAWLSDLLKITSFDELIIDEASQIVENSILGIISKADKTILIGDQNQLPPITSQTAEGFVFTHPSLTGLCYGAYNQSLMERLYKVCQSKGWNHATTMLQQHWRMHEALAGLIQHFYADRLLAMQDRQKEALPASTDPLLAARVIWIDCPPSKHPYYDPLQVKLIQRILALYQEQGIISDYQRDIGIVAPFRAMIHALRKEFTPAQQEITIDTVERFQGSERRNIIITLPLHNKDALRTLEALSGDGLIDRKLNVSLSRAQERIIILGNRDFCLKSVHYAFLIDKITAAGNLLPYDQLL